MLKIVNGTVSDLANAILKAKLVRMNRLTIIKRLLFLQRGPEMFGEVDLRNHQQVALAAYRVTQWVENNRWYEQVRTNEYDLVLVGAGSTAAYYLDTLGPAHNKYGTLVIGQDNPWSNERGFAIPYINHTQRQIVLPSSNVTRYGGNESFVDRKNFGQEMEQRVKNLAGRVVPDRVTRIERSPEKGEFPLKLTTQGSGVFYAKRVVFVAGSGGVRKPRVDSQYKDAVIEMNTFIRDKATQEAPGAIVVWGSNAAIDAVAAAIKHKWTVEKWLYGGEDPAWLPGTRYLSKPYNLKAVPVYKYQDRNKIKIVDDSSPSKVKIVDEDNGTQVAKGLRYVVYGLGSNDLLAEVLDKESMLGENTSLVPILDEAGVFSNPSLPPPKDKAFLGWGTQDGSLLVFGLAAENYEKDRRRIAPTDPRVIALKHWLSGDVLTVGQLSYIRSAMRAVNNFVPGSIEHRVDFSHADATQLRVHLAARYPDLPEPMANWFIGVIADFRKDPKIQRRLPHGFTKAQVKLLEKTLRELEKMGKDFNARFGRLQQDMLTLTPREGVEVVNALRKIRSEDR